MLISSNRWNVNGGGLFGGYGSYRYTESGRTGEAPLAVFAIRGRELVVSGRRRRQTEDLVGQAWQAQDGQVCPYFQQLADLDKSVLEQLIVGLAPTLG
jgi:hypothetical protein